MLDTNHSSADLRIRHVDLTMSRLDKVKLIVDWDVALQNIKVCVANWPGNNCGKCEKCIRTQLALLVLGVLDRSRAFPIDDLSEELVKTASIRPLRREHFTISHHYLELIPHLSRIGRHDLVRGIEHIATRSWKEDSLWRARVKRFDNKYLNGVLLKLRDPFIHNST